MISTGHSTTTGTHRFSWELHFGPIPAGLFVCHHCDTRLCVRPDHLFLGTAGDNNRDAHRKGRGQRGERHHAVKLTEAQVRMIRASTVRTAVLAAQYGVTWPTIHEVRSGHTWKHLEE